jgi:hypothetical protein
MEALDAHCALRKASPCNPKGEIHEKGGTMKIKLSKKLVAVGLTLIGVLFHSMIAVAQNPVSFNAMMQPAGLPAAVPPMPDTSQPTPANHITRSGKAEIGTGIFLVAAGVTTLWLTMALDSTGWAPNSSKAVAGFAAGTGATVGGFTLIVLGSRNHPAK